MDGIEMQTYPVLRKKPPKRRNGITTGGPMDSAMFTLLLMEEIK
jgi:hypothetical protein